MRKNYIQVENMAFLRLSNAEFISFMERFMALLPLEDDEEGGQHAPKLGITAELVAEGKAFLASMNDLTLKSQLKAETKPKKETRRPRRGCRCCCREALPRGEALPGCGPSGLQPGDGGDQRFLVGYEQDGEFRRCTGLGH